MSHLNRDGHLNKLGRQASQKLKRRSSLQRLSKREQGRFQELLATLVHELGNPIAAMRLRGQMFKRQLPHELDPFARRASDTVDLMLAASRRMEAILRNMSSVADESQGDPFVMARVQGLLDEAMYFSRERCSAHDVTVSIDPFDADLGVICREGQVLQILINLLNNSCDALQNAQDKWIRLSVFDRASTVEIVITDSGKGIDPALREHLFNPFVTTKGPGEGHGLGLHASRQIAEQHRGSLVLDETHPNTCFVLSLPK